MEINSLETLFLVALDHFSQKNGHNDLARGLFFSLNIGPYILPIYRPLSIFFDQFGGAQMAQKWPTTA
jgi:hypothetical protein